MAAPMMKQITGGWQCHSVALTLFPSIVTIGSSAVAHRNDETL